jgi:nucleoporin POM152
VDQSVFSSIQPRTRFQLRTTTAGRVYYEVKQIGDAGYPLQKHSPALPLSERLLFEQQVLQRPSARFKSSNRLQYCMHDLLTPRGAPATDSIIALEGTPPFTLELSIKSLASSEVQIKSVEILETPWKVDLPSYSFKSIGPHLIKIESIQDASHCAQAPPDPLSQSVWVDVAETAAIVPIDRRKDYCVGDVSKFQLEGKPPWMIGSVAQLCQVSRPVLNLAQISHQWQVVHSGSENAEVFIASATTW